MPLAPGTRLGPYEIVASLGAGGMGEVFEAKDTRLDRTVAIKVLPDELAENPQRKERFHREARAISHLNHPHICTLYDVGEDDGVDFIVMEYLEGGTLADLLKRGPLSLDKALAYGSQIAAGLDAAHRERVVHRDLKPANVMITKSGVKLLDFGLAKLVQGELDGEASDAPTRQKDLTKKQSILGTLQYMAPEQLESKPVDHRTDIFAFGAVLYEMVSGSKAFEGETQASLITAIMSATPRPLTDMVTLAPPSLDHVVAKALSKDPENRWQSARDLTTELAWIGEAGGISEPLTAESASGWRWKLATAAACLLAAASVWLSFRAQKPEGPTVRFTVPIRTMSEVAFALSPNGRHLAYTESGALWIRALDAIEAESVPGTASVEALFWSPDSRYVAFFERGQLQRVDLLHGVDGPVIALCEVARGSGGTWSADGVIVFESGGEGPLLRVDANGGEPIEATRLDPTLGESNHRLPQFLPDGRRFLYLGERSRTATTGVFVGSLDSVETRHLVADMGDTSHVLFAPPDLLLFTRGVNWFAQAFDTDTLELRGEPAVFVQNRVGPGRVSVSATGVVAYRTPDPDHTLTWFDRAGRELGVVSVPGAYTRLHLSADDSKAVAGLNVIGTTEVLDLGRGTRFRFPGKSHLQIHPVFSPDGERIVFAANPDGPEDLYVRASDGLDEAELLHGSPVPHKHPSDWSKDGRYVLFDARLGDGMYGVFAVPVSGKDEAKALRTARQRLAAAVLSPDGRWVAYNSEESGRFEVYLQDFPEGKERWRISTEGGAQARWRGDGKELFYLDLDSKLMVVDFAVDAGGEPTFGLPVPLFQTRVPQGPRHLYDVTADGERFLMIALAGEPSPIVIVVNAFQELQGTEDVE